MTWISAHKPQRKTLCVYPEPHIQPGQRPCPQGLGTCCPTDWGQIGSGYRGVENQPTHFPTPVACLCGGVRRCRPHVRVEERPLVRPEWSRQTVSPLSGWSGACGAASRRDVWTCSGGQIEGECASSSPNICSVSILLNAPIPCANTRCPGRWRWPLSPRCISALLRVFILSTSIMHISSCSSG